jgi:exodeoxyribonuclease V gamma subunit
MLIVPNRAIKAWLMLQLANDPEVGIAAGIEISYLDQSVQRLKELFFPSASAIKLPNAVELALTIEWELKNALLRTEDKIWDPLYQYLVENSHFESARQSQIEASRSERGSPSRIGKVDEEDQFGKALASQNENFQLDAGIKAYLHFQSGGFSPKQEKRLISLSEKLASLFLEYGKYGGKAILDWETAPPEHWQIALWQKIFGINATWSYLYRALSNAFPIPSPAYPISIHLFSISFLPRVYSQFFNQLATRVNVHHYLLSPCQLFWSDVQSDKEVIRQVHYWDQKGASPVQLNELELYLKDRNALLANFGRLGREMARQIEEQVLTTKECYVPFEHSESLLQSIQSDMLSLRNPSEEPLRIFEKYDKSIQVHGAPTRLREVQAIYDILLDIIDKHANSSDPIQPSDIVVMAPNILEYEPFIKMVFLQPASLLDVQIMDLHLAAQSPLAQGFLHLIELPFGSWDAHSLLHLFQIEPFQKKHSLSSEEIEIFEEWVIENGVNWGHDVEHRRLILRQRHCEKDMVESNPAGTWEFGIDRLLAGLIYDASHTDHLSIAPYANISFSQADLLGKSIALVRSLHQDLAPLADGTCKSLADWSTYLQMLLNKYFENSDSEENHEIDLNSMIATFREASQAIPKACFSFISLKNHLETALSKTTAIFRETHFSAIRFCSILPMRTLPAKVIVWMGMHEGAFPRQDQTSSLNLLADNPKADFMPSQTDFDRYLFLESLLSAQQYFILSYLNYSSTDGQEQTFSIMTAELLNYLDSAYRVDGKLPSMICHYRHPFNAFDKKCFQEGSLFPSYAIEQYLRACAFYHTKKIAPHKFIPQFIKRPEPHAVLEMLELKDLSSFASNPLKTYFNKGLGIYLENKKTRSPMGEEKYQLDPLEKSILVRKTLEMPLQKLVAREEKKGTLPAGQFKKLAIDLLQEKRDVLFNNLSKGGVDPNKLFEIEFSEKYSAPSITKEGSWRLPPLLILYRGKTSIQISGIFENVSEQGLILHKNGDKIDVIKTFPEIIIFQKLIQYYCLPIQTKYIFAKDGKVFSSFTDNPEPDIQKYLDYFFFGRENACPLIPEWVGPLLTNNKENIEQILQGTMQGYKKSFYNDYVEWLLQKDSFIHFQDSFEEWQLLAADLYGALYEDWFSEKKGAKNGSK